MGNNDLHTVLGKCLVEQVRDRSIDKFDKTLHGTLRSPLALELNKNLSKFSSEEQELIRKLIVNSIDETVYNFLWMLEENTDRFNLFYNNDKGSTENVVHASDGLSGEIFSEDGWIATYSKYKENF